MSSSRDRVIDRARACFVGLIAGDCLGSVVDGMKPEVAARIFPDGPRMKDASKIGLLPGQPTAVAEMAIVLARKLARQGTYSRKLAAQSYRRWIDTEPFRLERDLAEVLAERAERAKPTGSVLARCVPIAVMSVRLHGDIRLTSVVEWVKEEMSLTHPDDKECADVAAIFACLLSDSIEYGARGESPFTLAARYGRTLEVEEELLAAVRRTTDGDLESMPKGPLRSLCCVLRCAARVKNPEKAVVAALTAEEQPSIHAAAVGALVGAQQGLGGLPESWPRNISICRPKTGQPQVRQPRPRDYWPADIHSLAASLSWTVGASTVPVLQRGRRQTVLDDDVEEAMRLEFEELVEKAATTGCKESLGRLGEMAQAEEGIDLSHKFMFSDFALALRKRQWLELALLHAERALALGPDDAHTHFNLARIYWQSGEEGKARNALAEALRIMPDMGYAKALLDHMNGKAGA